MNHARSPRLAAAAILLAAPAIAGDTLEVPAQYATLQAAVDAAVTGDTVLVGPGTYSGAGNRDVDLGNKDLVIRSAEGAEVTVIDCEGTLQVPYRGFIVAGGQTAATVIEGFTVKRGATEVGAIADPFNGGAVQILGTSPVLRDCVFENNLAACWGGAVFAGHGGTPLIERCLFRNNTSLDGGGGLFSWNGAAPTVRNCVFQGNDGTTTGGAIFHTGAIMTIEHSTFVENDASWAGGLALWGASLSHTIVWGNAGPVQVAGPSSNTASFCDFEGGLPDVAWDLGGNVDVDPAFGIDGFHLRLGSPLIGAGDPAATLFGALDFDGNPRKVGRVDIGADEFWLGPKVAR